MKLNELMEAAAAAWHVPVGKVVFELTTKRVAIRVSWEREPAAVREVTEAGAFLVLEPALAALIRAKAVERMTSWRREAEKLRGQSDAMELYAVELATKLEQLAPEHFDGVMGEVLLATRADGGEPPQDGAP